MESFFKNVSQKYNYLKVKKSILDFIRSLIIFLPLAFIIRTFGFGLYQVPTESMEPTLLVGERFLADKFTVQFIPIKRGDIISFNDPNFNYSKNQLINLFQCYVWGPVNVTKRVIAIPGDEINGRVENGKSVIYLKKKNEDEFKKLDEHYVNKNPIVALYNENSDRTLVYRSYDPSNELNEQPFYRMNSEQVHLGQKAALLIGQYPVKFSGMPIEQDIFDVKLKDNQYWVMGDNRLNSGDSRIFGPLDGKLIHGKIIFRIWSLDSDQSWWIFDLMRNPLDFFKRVRWNRCLQILN